MSYNFLSHSEGDVFKVCAADHVSSGHLLCTRISSSLFSRGVDAKELTKGYVSRERVKVVHLDLKQGSGMYGIIVHQLVENSSEREALPLGTIIELSSDTANRRLFSGKVVTGKRAGDRVHVPEQFLVLLS